jgi:hypothetical protein
MARQRVGWIGTGTLGGGITHGIEVYREDGQHEVVSLAVVHGWRVEMPLALQRGRVVVSGLRIAPAGHDVPSGGVTVRLLRRLPLHAHLEAFASRLRRPYQRVQVETLLVGTGLEPLLDAATAPPAPAGPRLGRRPIPLAELLRVAVAYDRAVRARSRQPVQDAARRLDLKMVRVRDYVHRARVSTPRLLDPAAWGRPGGTLTPEARALLQQQAKPMRNPTPRPTPKRAARRRAKTRRKAR